MKISEIFSFGHDCGGCDGRYRDENHYNGDHYGSHEHYDHYGSYERDGLLRLNLRVLS